MATLEFQTGTLTPLRDGDVERKPQIKVNRIKAILAQPGAEPLTVQPTISVMPAPLRRPGMAARWKGQHRLTISV